jgi:glutamyl-tRNA reductase
MVRHNPRLVAVGISHRTAPIEIRERLAVQEAAIPQMLDRLRADGMSKETVLLSTCNRVEMYCVPGERGTPERLARWLAESGGLAGPTADAHIYQLAERDALHHIFRVASSLDSMVLGEPQILGQVKTAYRIAQEHRAAGPVMHRVMNHALNVAKRVRTETRIGHEAVSIGRSGVELARQVLGSLEGRAALLVGAGAHGKVVARALLDFGLTELVVANRTFERAAELADHFGGSAVHMSEMARYFARVDIVVCSTAAGKVLIGKQDLAPALGKRRHRSLVLIDLAVPRNVDPAVNDLGGVFRFDVDDLAQIAGQGKERRLAAAEEAERIVLEASERFWEHMMGEAVHDRIGGIVRQAEVIRLQEIARLAAASGMGDDQQAAVDAMTRAIVKKVLHGPLSHLRGLAQSGDIEATEMVLRAFGEVTAEGSSEDKDG